jgi:hypothetical protein
MKRYEKVTEKSITLFKNDLEPGSKKPKFSNGNVTIAADLSAGRYSIGVWEWADSGNLSIDIQKITEVDDNDEGEFR